MSKEGTWSCLSSPTHDPVSSSELRFPSVKWEQCQGIILVKRFEMDENHTINAQEPFL